VGAKTTSTLGVKRALFQSMPVFFFLALAFLMEISLHIFLIVSLDAIIFF